MMGVTMSAHWRISDHERWLGIDTCTGLLLPSSSLQQSCPLHCETLCLGKERWFQQSLEIHEKILPMASNTPTKGLPIKITTAAFMASINSNNCKDMSLHSLVPRLLAGGEKMLPFHLF